MILSYPWFPLSNFSSSLRCRLWRRSYRINILPNFEAANSMQHVASNSRQDRLGSNTRVLTFSGTMNPWPLERQKYLTVPLSTSSSMRPMMLSDLFLLVTITSGSTRLLLLLPLLSSKKLPVSEMH